jgi:hypothetical protein
MSLVSRDEHGHLQDDNQGTRNNDRISSGAGLKAIWTPPAKNEQEREMTIATDLMGRAVA